MELLKEGIGGGRKLLLISSPGGHIAELWRIERALGRADDSLWITSKNEQTEALLKGRRVIWVPYIAPRDVKGAALVARKAAEVVRAEKFDVCISAGAALAAFALPRVALSGVRTVYVESLARQSAPSTTGKIARLSPRVETWAQHPELSFGKWRTAGSVLDAYSVLASSPRETPLKILVTLGTIRPYRFDRLVDGVMNAIQNCLETEVTWQLGSTVRQDLPGEVYFDMPLPVLKQKMSAANVVIGHAGVGTVLDSLESGASPIVYPRCGENQEHVDSHQIQLAGYLVSRGLAQAVLPGEQLTQEMLMNAARLRVVQEGVQ